MTEVLINHGKKFITGQQQRIMIMSILYSLFVRMERAFYYLYLDSV